MGSSRPEPFDSQGRDLEDIKRADALVLLTGERDSPGKMTEVGYALGTSKPIYPVGTRRTGSIFAAFFAPQVTVEQFLTSPFVPPGA